MFAAAHLLEVYRSQAKNTTALDDLVSYLRACAEWMPNYRARRRGRLYSGSGHVEQANARIVARRQKHHGVHWGVQTCEALAALRTLQLNNGWDTYWFKRQALPLHNPDLMRANAVAGRGPMAPGRIPRSGQPPTPTDDTALEAN